MPRHTRRRASRARSVSSRIPSIEDPQSANVVADWAEFYVTYYRESLSRMKLGRYLEQNVGSEANFDLNAAWKELERRQFLYGDTPPFNISGACMETNLRWQHRPEYMACLLWSLMGNPRNTTATGKLFERLSGEAARKYFQGDLIIYGYPSRQTVKNIATKLNEKFAEKPAARFNDRGVDLIVWKQFKDKRGCQIVMLAQCASGKNWRMKIGTMPYDAWCYYIHWACKPVRGFTVPVIIQDQVMWDISTQAGLLFDRARIYKNIPSRSIDRRLRTDLRAWCAGSIPNFINS